MLLWVFNKTRPWRLKSRLADESLTDLAMHMRACGCVPAKVVEP